MISATSSVITQGDVDELQEELIAGFGALSGQSRDEIAGCMATVRRELRDLALGPARASGNYDVVVALYDAYLQAATEELAQIDADPFAPAE